LDVKTEKSQSIPMGSSSQWSPNGRWLADIGTEGNLQVFDLMTGQITQAMSGVSVFTWTPSACPAN
jgi:hypothetical protein